MTTDEQAIRALVARWHSATMAGDVDQVLGLMSEDVIFLVTGQAPMRGRATFETGLRTLLKSHRIVSSAAVQEVEVAGNLAYCWTKLTVRIEALDGGAPAARAGNAMSILRKQDDGRWLLVRDANMLAPQA